MQPSLQRLIAFVSVLALSCVVAHRAAAQCPGDVIPSGTVNAAWKVFFLSLVSPEQVPRSAEPTQRRYHDSSEAAASRPRHWVSS
jgi:hypothetical protein